VTVDLLDEVLKDSFPASDPPSSSGAISGVRGASDRHRFDAALDRRSTRQRADADPPLPRTAGDDREVL
jgi:hypothetical protein